MINRCRSEGFVSERQGVAEGKLLSAGGRYSRPKLVRRQQQIEFGSFGPHVAEGENDVPSDFVFHPEIPTLRVRRAEIGIHGVSVAQNVWPDFRETVLQRQDVLRRGE